MMDGVMHLKVRHIYPVYLVTAGLYGLCLFKILINELYLQWWKACTLV